MESLECLEGTREREYVVEVEFLIFWNFCWKRSQKQEVNLDSKSTNEKYGNDRSGDLNISRNELQKNKLISYFFATVYCVLYKEETRFKLEQVH